MRHCVMQASRSLSVRLGLYASDPADKVRSQLTAAGPQLTTYSLAYLCRDPISIGR